MTSPEPDTTTSLPRLGFEFSPGARDEADALVTGPPAALYQRLLRDQESEAVLLAARRVLGAFLAPHLGQPVPGPHQDRPGPGLGPDAGADEIAEYVAGVRAGLAAELARLAESRAIAVRQRAPIGQLGGCWLDVVSQPATQPSVIVNRLHAQHMTLRGNGRPERSVAARRRRAAQAAGIYLPDVAAAGFLDAAGARPLTALQGCFYLALSRLPASFLPELTGVHYAVFALGLDELLAGPAEPALPETELRGLLAQYLDLARPADRARLRAGLDLALELEREQVSLLAELARWHADRPLTARAAEVLARHAPYAGSHHQRIRVGGESLADLLSDPGLDLPSLMTKFRETPYLRDDRFLRALKLGGPMFGIFDEAEAAVLRAWAASVQAGERAPVVLTAPGAGDEIAGRRGRALAEWAPEDVSYQEPGPLTDRELFYRLINIESFASTLPLARQRASELFAAAEVLFDQGARGRYTDASYFAYRPEALLARAERVYWDKLVAPYRPLTEIPDRDEVIFLQTTYALGALVDAAWIHRVAGLGRGDRPWEAALLAIYADEIGQGDLAKNHITLIYRALRSMDIVLPHIRDAAFRDQADLPDELYGFSLHQLCLALFPDSFLAEILGYNLAIEMFGLGELRLHEIQKLRHHGLDDCYEQAHLTIDNISAGHSRQAADIIIAYLDDVARTLGPAAAATQWRRVWRGYASLAWFVEHELLRELDRADEPAEGADLLI